MNTRVAVVGLVAVAILLGGVLLFASLAGWATVDDTPTLTLLSMLLPTALAIGFALLVYLNW